MIGNGVTAVPHGEWRWQPGRISKARPITNPHLSNHQLLITHIGTDSAGSRVSMRASEPSPRWSTR